MPTAKAAPIVLIGRFGPGEQPLWLDALGRAMPEERLLPLESIAEPARIELAIVADPDPAAVRRFPSLTWVQSLWAGVERLLAEPAFDDLPIVRMIDPELSRTMAEAVLAWTLYLHRDMPAYLAQQRRRQWRPLPYTAPAARRIGLLGLGVLGQAAARSLLAAGFTVQAWRRTGQPAQDGLTVFSGDEGLAAMAAQTDVLVCLLPLTTQTRSLVDASVLAHLPRGASLINFGRGPVVHTQALLDALDRGRLAHAVLDVFDEEPLPPHSRLWEHPAVTILPHVSADSDPQTASRIVAANVRQWRATGRIPTAVDRQRGY
jgi:glyoxylate/hydroxypyruvate reductase A